MNKQTPATQKAATIPTSSDRDPATLASMIDVLQRELQIAQTKRGGHYKKLTLEIERNAKLTTEVSQLQDALDRAWLGVPEFQRINDELAEARQQIATLRAELDVAQQKRAGHYAKLQYEIERNRKLEKQVKIFESELNRVNNSLTWDLGSALVGTKSIRQIFTLPLRLWQANQRYKEKMLKRRMIGAEAKRTDVVAIDVPVSAPAPAKPKTSDISLGEDLSILGWPAPPAHAPVTAMTVFDEFSRECFAPYLNLVEPRPDNWSGLLLRDQPEFLLVESAWRGNRSSWQYRVGSYAHPPGRELQAMVNGFKERGIPTVFWNKEDPVHFNNFIEAASQFDFVFTTAEEAMPKYTARSSSNVNVLPFACEPGLHNPIGSSDRNGKLCFAGSYYANRFADRRDDQIMLLDAAMKYKLDIFDRNHAAGTKSDFAFPERFQECIRGSLPYDEMSRAYRRYSVFLNVNSVIDSRTMFSRRVYELLACGTPVVSTRSLGIDEAFGKDLVWTVDNAKEADEAVRALLESPDEWRRRSLRGIRAVFSEHTFAHRTQQILDTVGIKKRVIEDVRVLVFAIVENSSEAWRVADMFVAQDMSVSARRLVLFAREGSVKSVDMPDVEVVSLEGRLGEALARASAAFDATHVGVFSPRAFYGKWYLQDLLHAFVYSQADVVAKSLDGTDRYAFDTECDPNAWLLRWKPGQSQVLEALGPDGVGLGGQGALRSFSADSANYLSDVTKMSETALRSKIATIQI
ncbi:glycosyltransferase [Burkholderia sp. ZZQ-2]|uniref:glycosyltransferase family protein n=1 Tax=Burkholderia sp. ZZQ-2 TaxID=1661766 RepID=UPI003D6E8340